MTERLGYLLSSPKTKTLNLKILSSSGVRHPWEKRCESSSRAQRTKSLKNGRVCFFGVCPLILPFSVRRTRVEGVVPVDSPVWWKVFLTRLWGLDFLVGSTCRYGKWCPTIEHATRHSYSSELQVCCRKTLPPILVGIKCLPLKPILKRVPVVEHPRSWHRTQDH